MFIDSFDVECGMLNFSPARQPNSYLHRSVAVPKSVYCDNVLHWTEQYLSHWSAGFSQASSDQVSTKSVTIFCNCSHMINIICFIHIFLTMYIIMVINSLFKAFTNLS